MASAANRKAIRDLTRRRTRSILTILTLALAIASIGMLAVPTLLDRAMTREVTKTKLYDIAVSVRDTNLTAAQLGELRAIPNITGVTARLSYPTRVRVGERNVQATVWSVPDFANQPVDVVRIASGHAPSIGQLLGDTGNKRNMNIGTAAGDAITIVRSNGTTVSVPISGAGRSLAFSQMAGENDNKHIVLYASDATVRNVSGARGYNYLEFRASDTTKTALDATVARIRAWLTANAGTNTLIDLPATRTTGDWPGRESMTNLSSMFLILAALAVLTSIFLIANTMNTLVAEQTREIGVMKAIGGRRRQIAAVFFRSAAVLGATGAVVGVLAGVFLATAITRFFASDFFSVPAPFGVDVPVAIGSGLFAVCLTLLAAVPALRRALRVPVVDSLEDRGVAAGSFGTSAIDRAVLHSRLLPRDAQLGVRNVFRNKRRTLATAVQISLAVALALGMLGLGTSLMRGLNDYYKAHRYDATAAVSEGARPLDAAARTIAAATPGVARVDGVLQNMISYRGKTQLALGFGPNPPYAPDVSRGRWFSNTEQQGQLVTVIGPTIARQYGLHVDDDVSITTAGGPVQARVIGIDDNQWNNGSFFFLPLRTLQSLSGWRDSTNGLWITTTRHDHAFIDHTTTAVEERLIEAGYPARTSELYIQQRDNRASNQSILTLTNVMGLIIVAISMIGLASAITMSVLERTREIGVLRCIGARSKDIRRAFATEGIAIGLLGWIIGLPLGWLLTRALVAWMLAVFNLTLPTLFPFTTALVVLVATVVLASGIVIVAARRGTRIRPGDALRYV